MKHPYLILRTNLVLMSLLAFVQLAVASGEVYLLDWPRPAENLEYRSCGCADECWVASVKQERSGKILARLRCDCHSLYYQAGKFKAETQIASNCDEVADEHKFENISRVLYSLVRSPLKKPKERQRGLKYDQKEE